jgi:homoserine kinase
MIRVRVPASTANLGPGFEGEGVKLHLKGEGADELPKNQRNLVAAAVMKAYHAAGREHPQGLKIECLNRIPLRSGLGSSCAAALCGILGANALMGTPLDNDQMLALVVEMEGHPDNAAAALHGGLVIVAREGRRFLLRRVSLPPWQTAVVLPKVKLRTKHAREVLPREVAHQDAVFNLGHSALVVEAFRTGDLLLLKEAMQDRLHEDFRYELIPGSKQAIEAAREMGAAAALSGAGPAVAAFTLDGVDAIADGIAAAFSAQGVKCRQYVLQVSEKGGHAGE